MKGAHMLRMILLLAGLSFASSQKIAAVSSYQIPVEERAAYISGFRSTSSYRLYFYHAKLPELGYKDLDDTNFATILDDANYLPSASCMPQQSQFMLRWRYYQVNNSISITHPCPSFVVSGQIKGGCSVENKCGPMGSTVDIYPASFPGAKYGDAGFAWTIDEMTATYMRISIPEGFLAFEKLASDALPDLIPDSLLAFKAEGDSLIISFQLLNAGSKAAKRVPYDLYYNGKLLGRDTVDSIQGGFLAPKAFRFPRLESTTSVKIILDPDNAIREAAEKNNTLEESWLTPGVTTSAIRPEISPLHRNGRNFDILGRRPAPSVMRSTSIW